MFSYINFHKNHVYATIYENGKKIYKKEKIKPYIWIKTHEKSNLRSFPDFISVKRINFKDFYDLKNFVDMIGQDKIYGMVKDFHLLEYIRENQLRQNFNKNHLKVFFYDIEVWTNEGFPNPDSAKFPIISIAGTIRYTNKYYLWTLHKNFDKEKWLKHKYPIENIEEETKKLEEKLQKLYKEKDEKFHSFHKNEKIKKEYQYIEFYLKDTIKEIEKIEIALKHYQNYTKEQEKINNLEIFTFNTDKELLEHFIKWIRQNEIDVISGWNSSSFDDRYVFNRIVNILGENKLKELSPFNYIKKITKKTSHYEEYHTYDIVGITFIDYMELDKHYRTNKRISYKLGHVTQEEVGFGKVEYEDEDLTHLWERDKDLFTIYNLGDVECLEALDLKLDYINIAYNIAHYTGSPIHFWNHNTYIWEAHLFNQLLEQNLVIKSSEKPEAKEPPIVGAYVKDPILGWKEFIISLDYTSLYPSSIIWCNMSHETIKRREENVNYIEDFIHEKFDFTPFIQRKEIITPYGLIFDNSRKGIIVQIIENLLKLRKEHKKLYKEYSQKAKEEHNPMEKEKLLELADNYYGMQLAEKVLMNSFYGALQVDTFALHHRDFAEAITTIGQVANRYVARKLNLMLNKLFKTHNIDYVIGGDTDSMYLDITGFIDHLQPDLRSKGENAMLSYITKITDEFIVPYSKKIIEEMTNYFGYRQGIMNLDREVIARGGFWKAKKRYALLIYDNEGLTYEIPKMKIMGMQIVRSDTPEKLKKYMKDFVHRLLRRMDIKNFVKQVKKEFFKLNYDEIAMLKGLNVFEDYWDKKATSIVKSVKKGSPIHVKGSIYYNFLIEKMGLSKKYPIIELNDKVKFLYLQSNNPYGISVIAYKTKLPEEFNLQKYIDYHTMYEKLLEKFFLDMASIVDREKELTQKQSRKLF